jgi:hypothetical protein
LVLVVLCAAAGFVLIWIGAGKGRAENERLVAEARAQAKRE